MPLDIFVYGTLQRRQANHAAYCGGVTEVEPARTPGRIWHLPAGYPALEVDPAQVLAPGSADPLADALLQREWERRLEEEDSGRSLPEESATVHGEWMRLIDPHTQLPPLDRLEVFRPGRRSLYQRVLVRVWCDREPRVRTAWSYVQENPRGTHLPGGRWPAPGSQT